MVEHHSDAPTAMFDVKDRVLVLPVWRDMSTNLYDMLVGHEVGHALYTPAEHDGMDLAHLIMDIAGDGGDHALVKALLNIVEDARIERMMQDKFPGLKRDFVAAYDDLHNNRDFFGLSDKNVADLTFADRINIHFKIGNMVSVPFSDEEQVIIDRIANNVNTFGEVVELVRELYPSIKAEMDEQNEEVAASPEGESESVPMSGENGENTDENGESEDSGEADSGDDNGDSMEDDTDDGESAESNQSNESNSTGGGDVDGETPVSTTSGLTTVDEFDKKMESLKDESNRWSNTSYKTLADFNETEWVISPEDTWKGMPESMSENCNVIKSELDKKVAKGASLLAKQFEMKKAADAHKRTTVAKTGVIDTVKMVNYKLTEDIFRRNSIVSDGKNHGLVLFLDMSGSMYDNMASTIEQLYLLATFCKKVNIPFDIYGFSSYTPWNHRWTEEDSEVKCPITDNRPKIDDEYGGEYVDPSCEQVQPCSNMCLYHMVSSNMKKNAYKDAMTALACYKCHFDGGTYQAMPRHLNLGGTPLDDCIVLARDLVNTFRKNNNLQVVHSIFLTDGDSHGGCINSSTHMRDGRKVYETTKKGNDYRYGKTSFLLEWFRKTTGAKAIGMFLTSTHRDMLYKMRNSCEYDQQADLKKQFTKQKFVNAGEVFGYSEFFILKSDTKVESASLDELDSDASFTRMKSAFLKSQKGSIVSRTVLNRVADLISE